jgi:quinol-cytochrome oxidoreductase complex cytochrome b subunit
MVFLLIIVLYVAAWHLYRAFFLHWSDRSPFTQPYEHWRQERIAVIGLTALMAGAAIVWCLRWQACVLGGAGALASAEEPHV